MNAKEKDFQKRVKDMYKKSGRNLPWRKTTDPYKILISEVMLQQTQVPRVLEKYKSFLKRFPTLEVLARARQASVIKEWQGLGYNRRAIFLHKIAKIIQKEYGGIFPKEKDQLKALPGIGENTAGSIQAFAFNIPTVFIETNIRRVFIHEFFKNKKEVSDEQ